MYDSCVVKPNHYFVVSFNILTFKGKKECALCKFCMCGSSFTHAKTNNFEACISALFAGGYKVLDIQLSLLGCTLTAARQPLLQYARKESKHPKKYHQEKLGKLCISDFL